MKKFLLFSFCILTSIALSAQIWEDNFDDGDISDWTTIDADGDGFNWAASPNGVNGSGCIDSESWNAGVGPLRPNNYITSPVIDLTSAAGTVALSWKAYGQDQAWAAEKYKVIVSTANDQAAIDGGDILFEETLTAAGAQVWFERTVNLTPYVGQMIHVTFVHFEVTDFFRLNVDDVSVFSSASDDAGVTAVVAPSNGTTCMFTDAEAPSMTIFNFGGNTLSNFDVSYSVNGGTPVVETVTADVEAAASYDYVFATPFDASALGEYTIEFSTMLAGDTDPSNDSYMESFTHSDAVMTVHVQTDVSGPHAWEVIDNSTGNVIAEHGSYAWDQEFFDDVCIFSDRCYSFNYAGEMGAGAYLEILIDGVQVSGDTNGTGVAATMSVPSIGGGCKGRDASAVSLNFQPYQVVDSDVAITGEIRNLGADEITSLAMSYSIDGGTPVMDEFTGLNVQPGEFYTFGFGTFATIADLTEYDVVVNVMGVNGADDENPDNNMVSSELVAVSYIPAKKVLAEEATGTWCGFCPRGAEMMDMMSAQYEDFIGIAVHNSDPMVVTEYDGAFGSLIGGYPSMVLDRVNTEAMPGNIADFNNLVLDYQARLNVISPAAVDLEVSYTGSGDLAINVNSEFVAPLEGDYRVGVIITEDGLSGTTQDWAQVNYYAGGGLGVMNGWELLPDPVAAADMVYDHVAVALLGGFDGMPSSLPASIGRGDVYSQSFTYNVADLSRLANMHVIGMIIDNRTGAILNANSTNLFTTDVEDIEISSAVRVFPNPAYDVANVEVDVENADVRMTVINATGQVITSKNYGTINGKMLLPVITNDLENGMYIIRLDIDDTVVTKKLNVVK